MKKQRTTTLYAANLPRDGSVEVSPWHVGDHDQLREDDDKYQVRTQFEETVDGWNSEGQGDGDSAGANDGDFHAIAQFFLRGLAKREWRKRLNLLYLTSESVFTGN